MEFTPESVYLLAMETAHLMHREQLKFEKAFRKAFSKLRFDSKFRRAARIGTRRFHLSWREKEKERKEFIKLTGSQNMRRQAHEKECPLH